jgi:ABC-type Fe3+/spermidine/putrescine transport system ATPase subunit
MTALSLQNIRKSFQNGTRAVDDFNLEVEAGEFVTLLGPSGCGKTTTLRCVAGLEKPDSGRIEIDGKVVFDRSGIPVELPPERRGLAMVFQQYALWPHMNVFENVAFGLKSRKFSKSDIASKTERALKSVRLWDQRERQIGQLSGGQQQRISLARAIAPDPKVVLFDEPLSNLDVKLRDTMRLEILELQRDLGLTAIYVTHDQDEAFSLSSRIVVMSEGKVEQIDTPAEVWGRPATSFVAGFIGSSTRVDGTVSVGTGGSATLQADGLELELEGSAGLRTGERASAFVRSGDLELHQKKPAAAKNVWNAKIELQSFHGDYTQVFVRVGSTRFICRTSTPIESADGTVWVHVPAKEIRAYADSPSTIEPSLA